MPAIRRFLDGEIGLETGAAAGVGGVEGCCHPAH